jgi:hypothetical protein
MTLRAVAIAAGVVGIPQLTAVITLVDVAPKVRRTAGRDISERPGVSRGQAGSELGEIRLTMEADDVGHLQHDGLWSKIRGRS